MNYIRMWKKCKYYNTGPGKFQVKNLRGDGLFSLFCAQRQVYAK